MKTLLIMQRGEITEHYIYKKIAAAQKDPHNREVVNRIAQDDLGIMVYGNSIPTRI